MSVIIRLQNLPWSANALDIRQYFQGLSIPEGGVHIVGGELGDAFIAFSTDEDARQAFMRNGGKIKEVQISLMLSSRTEMQRVIEQARMQSFTAFMQPVPVVPQPAAVPVIDKRRRSRSKSKERRDRSRERDRDRKRHRRSRSRSRDRKSRRRRSRSRSKSRDRDKDKERKSRKRSDDESTRKSLPETWSSNLLNKNDLLTRNNGFNSNGNAINATNNNSNNSRESWPPTATPTFNTNRFLNRSLDISDNCSISLEPFYGGYGDVRRFFQGMYIANNGIKFINDLSGRSTGVVYVRFSNRKYKEEALGMNGELLNGITVNITHINDEEFEEATDRYNPRVTDDSNSNVFKSRNITKYFNETITNFTCLVVDELPTYCKEQDILHMFSHYPLVALILTNKKRGGHIAYVKFSNSEIAKQALEDKSHHIVSGKQVVVQACKDEEFNEINKKHDVTIDTNRDNLNTDCLEINNLPEKTTDKDISDFFSDIGVIPNKIHLIKDKEGFTGRAYCEFNTKEEATRALRKNNTTLNNSSISVSPVNRSDVDCIKPSIPKLMDEEPKQLDIKLFPRVPMKFNNSRFAARGFGPRFNPRFNLRARFQPPKDVFDDVPPGCTVYMKNVPYKATTNDILNFFEGYNHTNNVSRRYNPNNTPSDEAKIIFFEPDEASRATCDLHKSKIWDRQIFLRQE